MLLGYPAWFGMALLALLSMNVLYKENPWRSGRESLGLVNTAWYVTESVKWAFFRDWPPFQGLTNLDIAGPGWTELDTGSWMRSWTPRQPAPHLGALEGRGVDDIAQADVPVVAAHPRVPGTEEVIVHLARRPEGPLPQDGGIRGVEIRPEPDVLRRSQNHRKLRRRHHLPERMGSCAAAFAFYEAVEGEGIKLGSFEGADGF